MNSFCQKISQTIRREVLFTEQDRLLLAVSGGPDSTALLLALTSLGYNCMAVHCNFHLRGAESDRDEQFVRHLCEQKHIELIVHDFDTKTYAEAHHVSIEMAARELRYAYFEQLLDEYGLAVVAVAHHRDDSVETFLLNLIRGTGLKGLTGMRYRNGRVVRPMLDVSRKDVTDYLKALGQDYVTDSTNLETEFLRNKIRLEILPSLRQINPSIDETVIDTAKHLQEADRVCGNAMAEGMQRVVRQKDSGLVEIGLTALLNEPSPEMLLFSLLYPLGFTPLQIKEILRSCEGQAGKVFESPTHDLLIDRESILVEPHQAQVPFEESTLGPGQSLDWTSGKLVCSLFPAEELKEIPKQPSVAVLDADRLQLPLTVRLAKEGDRFTPFGMKGSKLVSDFLTDLKMSRFEKQKQIVVCSGTDIVWLAGLRPDNRFAVEPNKTRNILRLEFIK